MNQKIPQILRTFEGYIKGGLEMACFRLSEVCRIEKCFLMILLRLASAGWYVVTKGI